MKTDKCQCKKNQQKTEHIGDWSVEQSLVLSELSLPCCGTLITLFSTDYTSRGNREMDKI